MYVPRCTCMFTPTNSKWQLITRFLHQRMSSFKSSVLYLSADFPFLSLHAYLLSDPPLCVVYTLHLLFSSLFSFLLYLFYMSGKKSLSFDFYFPLPSSSNLVTRRWQVRKRKGACEKWGLYSCCSTLSSSYMPPLLPEGWVCRTYLREKESGKKKKLSGGVRDGTEQQGTKTGERESESDFFFEGLSGHVEWEKRRDMRREEECGGVRSVYLPKESDSRLPANNPFLLLHFSESFCVLFCLSLYFSPSLSPRACFQKRPCQFTVTLHHLFSLFLIFLFHLPAFPFSIKYTWAFAGRPVFLSFLSLSNILWCFLPPLSQHFILTFQNQGALSLQEKCLNCTHDVGLIHGLECVCVCVFVTLPLLKNVCRPSISWSILVPWGVAQTHTIHIVCALLSTFNNSHSVVAWMSPFLCVFTCGRINLGLFIRGQGLIIDYAGSAATIISNLTCDRCCTGGGHCVCVVVCVCMCVYVCSLKE